MLHTETVIPSTLDLLKKIQGLPNVSGLRLVGGTALALHLGHRKSVDLDLFGRFDEHVSFRYLLMQSGDVADGSGAADEGVAPVHHEGAAPGRELLVPHGGEACQRAQDGLLPRTPPEGKGISG